MQLLQRGVDRSVIALWLGHESIEITQVYLHADLHLKEKALARTASSGRSPGVIARRMPSCPSWRACDYPASAVRPTQSAPALAAGPHVDSG